MKKTAIVSSIEAARKKRDQGKIEIYTVGAAGLESLLREKIYEALGQDKEALKAFQVEVFVPQNAEQRDALDRLGRNIFVVTGALGLDDSGVNMKAFSVNIEEGLSEVGDVEVAESLAHQCKICVAQMKRERKSNRGLAIASR